MKRNEPLVEFDAIIRDARMERGLAIGNAIGSVIAALSRGFDHAFAKIASGSSALRHVHQPRG